MKQDFNRAKRIRLNITLFPDCSWMENNKGFINPSKEITIKVETNLQSIPVYRVSILSVHTGIEIDFMIFEFNNSSLSRALDELSIPDRWYSDLLEYYNISNKEKREKEIDKRVVKIMEEEGIVNIFENHKKSIESFQRKISMYIDSFI